MSMEEYKTRHDWVGKVIHSELCKKFEVDHTSKWFMDNTTSVPKNHIQILQGFWDTKGSLNLGQTIKSYNKSKVKFAFLVEGDSKVPFLIATTQRCRVDAAFFPWLLHTTLDPYLIKLSYKTRRHQVPFLSLWFD